jgi:hypothetical protein
MTDARRPAGLDLFAAHVLADDAPAVAPIDRALTNSQSNERHPHKTVPIQVWVDVDEGVCGLVAYLNTISGVRTLASCQGTIGEGGSEPYPAQVMACWPSEAADQIYAEFEVTLLGNGWGYLRPKRRVVMQTEEAEVTLVLNQSITPRSWTVVAVNSDGDGGIDETTFSGPLAEKRAREYIEWRYGISGPVDELTI